MSAPASDEKDFYEKTMELPDNIPEEITGGIDIYDTSPSNFDVGDVVKSNGKLHFVLDGNRGIGWSQVLGHTPGLFGPDNMLTRKGRVKLRYLSVDEVREKINK